MKVIALTIFVLVHSIAYAQTGNYDSLVQRIMKLETSEKLMSDNLTRSHAEFRTGTALFVVGAVVTTASMALSDSQTVGLNSTIAMIGTVMMFAGGIIQIDSHRYIGRAGTKRLKFKLR